ncbi:MAG: hypothetical protein FWE69_03180 [Clostridiales bacterium]|nr:hypothetical protein [Clostridiales bacterium]
MVTLAQMYCRDNYSFWIEKYQSERTGNDYPYTYTDEDYNMFPRYLVLAAISKEIDMLVGQKRKSFSNCKYELLAAADYSDDEPNEKCQVTKEDEKRKYREFILSFDENGLANTTVKQLGFRRKLGKNESEKIRKKLAEKWNYDGSWYPIGGNPHEEALYLMEKYITPFEKEINDIIRSISLSRYYTIDEFGDDYKRSVADFTIPSYKYVGSETLCCDDTFDWIIYVSHESTISFGGDRLISQIKGLLKDYESRFDVWE